MQKTSTVAQLLLAVLLLTSCKKEEASNDSISIGKIETIHSKILDEKRTVWVHVPDDEADDSTRYPVLYLMDGAAHFKSVVGLMHQLSSVNGNMTCPKMMIVAIPNTDRTRDLTPSKLEANARGSDPKTGGGEAFTRFIAEELIPFVEKNYPATQRRTLVGHSLGGLMVINTLINHGDLFEKYLAIDPSLWWNDMKSLAAYEEALGANDLRGRSLFIAIANTIRTDTLTALRDTADATDHFRAIHRFVTTLRKTKERNGLDWRAKYYPDETHGSVPLIGEYDAFNFLYRKIPVSLDLAQLKHFEGTYAHSFRAGEEVFLHVVAQENALAVTESWRKVEMRFVPVGQKDFYNSDDKFPIEFRTNKEGEVLELLAFGTDVWRKVR